MTARRSTVSGVVTLAAATGLVACVHVPPRGRAAVRLAEYFEAHAEVPPSIADAMQRGHITLGMDREQVFAVLGDPIRRTRYRGPAGPEVWLYPGYRIHQGHDSGASLYRLVFVDSRLRFFEPI
jgi:hypothetical protein